MMGQTMAQQPPVHGSEAPLASYAFEAAGNLLDSWWEKIIAKVDSLGESFHEKVGEAVSGLGRVNPLKNMSMASLRPDPTPAIAKPEKSEPVQAISQKIEIESPIAAKVASIDLGKFGITAASAANEDYYLPAPEIYHTSKVQTHDQGQGRSVA
jgi:hypothetical protein